MASGVLAEGTLYLNRIVNGVKQGRVKVPGLATFKISPKSDKKEATTKDKGQYGQVVASVLLPQPTEFGVTITQVDGEALAMALMGELSTLSVGGGTVTDESIAAKTGKYIDLANKNITAASVVVTTDPAGTTYVEGTDYEINYAMGWFKALSGGAIADNAALLIDYAHGAISGQSISGSTLSEVRGEFVLDGRNLADGKELTITVDEGVVATDGEVDFMSDDFVELSLAGTMVTVAGKTQPYVVEFNKTLS
jgi:hypothetical protein